MENQLQNSVLESIGLVIEKEIEKKAREIIKKEFPFANRGFISTKEAAKYLNSGEETIKQMLEDGTLKALKKGEISDHNSIFFSSVLEYMEHLKSANFVSDKYFRNEQIIKEKAKRGLIRDCERLGIQPKK